MPRAIPRSVPRRRPTIERRASTAGATVRSCHSTRFARSATCRPVSRCAGHLRACPGAVGLARTRVAAVVGLLDGSRLAQAGHERACPLAVSRTRARVAAVTCGLRIALPTRQLAIDLAARPGAVRAARARIAPVGGCRGRTDRIAGVALDGALAGACADARVDRAAGCGEPCGQGEHRCGGFSQNVRLHDQGPFHRLATTQNRLEADVFASSDSSVSVLCAAGSSGVCGSRSGVAGCLRMRWILAMRCWTWREARRR